MAVTEAEYSRYEAWLERAAIAEYMGGLTRTEAERVADEREPLDD